MTNSSLPMPSWSRWRMRPIGWPAGADRRLLEIGRGLVMDVEGMLDLAAPPDGVKAWRL